VKGNMLLHDLAAQEYSVLAPHLQEVPMERGKVLAEAGDTLPYLYFPIEGVLSLVGTTENGATVEVADVGRDGMATVSAIFGTRTLPFRVVTKIAGRALRLPTDVVARQLRECGELHARLLESAESVIAQISQAAVCNRYHNAKERLARWLLTTADRAESAALPLTHEFISSMVGGPRSAVTEASAELRDAGAIEYSRGLLAIKNAEQLRSESCECYDTISPRMVVAGGR
jgi:CRP-like cAMP-binding protein